jgi:cation-transporting ATPase E
MGGISKGMIKRKPINRIETKARTGLRSAEVSLRIDGRWANYSIDPTTKSAIRIIAGNIFTYFNLLFFLLACCVFFVGSYRDLTFMPVVIINTIIGIVQELRSKQTLDKLKLLTAPKARVIRDSEERLINSEDTVIDDVAIFASGNQIYADAIILEGTVQLNEALITGEADEVTKTVGDTLLSGSFIVAGTCFARLDKVGPDSFASKITVEAKKMKKKRSSEMMRSLTILVQCIGIIIIPVGLLLFYNQHYTLNLDLRRSVVSTVGALVGMIPEGLYLLTSVALTVGVIRLARNKTLVHDLGCIETLARVDILCVDKTGTITEPKMEVIRSVPLSEERFSNEEIYKIMSDYTDNMEPDNETMAALREYFKAFESRRAMETLPFSSSLKYSGLEFSGGESYLLGAPEIILGADYECYRKKIEPYSTEGYRVLLLCLYEGKIKEGIDSNYAFPIALILMSNKIRKEAPATFSFFAKQGVNIKVISGDNPVTVSNIALKAGIVNAEKHVDATTLDTQEKLRAAATEFTVFGRVTPTQKKELVIALKAAGHKVAMTGDGVNDVLALKEADCSIAMASGSDAACRVSQLVLLSSNFGAMPFVVMEGRRVINNIERAASLYLVKNIFSLLLALISVLAVLPYPVRAAQLTLVGVLTIGIPSFILAIEPNKEIVRGRFLRNVLFRALPAGLTNVILVVVITLFAKAFNMPHSELSTISVIMLSEVGLIMLYRTCKPFDKIRKTLWVSMAAGSIFCIIFLKDFFALSPLSFGGNMVLFSVGLAALPVIRSISDILDFLSLKLRERKETKRQAAAGQ